MKLLVVDDIGYSRHSLAIALERLGHDVVQAETGNEGLSILRKDHTVEAVITDLIMDGIDGVELFIRAKRLESIDDQGKTSFPPFILLTCAQPGRLGATKAVLVRLKLATEIGFAKILFKPISPKVIADAIDGLRSAMTAPHVDIAPLITHLKDITLALIRDENSADAERLKRSLQEHLLLLEPIALEAES